MSRHQYHGRIHGMWRKISASVLYGPVCLWESCRATGAGGNGAGSVREASTGAGALETADGLGAGLLTWATDCAGRCACLSTGLDAAVFRTDALAGADVGPPSIAERTICELAGFGASSMLEPLTFARSCLSPSSMDAVLDRPHAARSTAIAAATDAATFRALILSPPNANHSIDDTNAQEINGPERICLYTIPLREV